jgi:hypothetical protein
MTPDPIPALEAAAKAATPGPWEATPSSGRPGHGYCAQVFGADGAALVFLDIGPQHDNNARYIALANPATILALLAERDGLATTLKQHDEAAEMAVRAACADNARLRAEAEAMRREREEAVGLLKQWHQRGHLLCSKDHACDQCVPGGEIVITGYLCFKHATAALLARPSAADQGGEAK